VLRLICCPVTAVVNGGDRARRRGNHDDMVASMGKAYRESLRTLGEPTAPCWVHFPARGRPTITRNSRWNRSGAARYIDGAREIFGDERADIKTRSHDNTNSVRRRTGVTSTFPEYAKRFAHWEILPSGLRPSLHINRRTPSTPPEVGMICIPTGSILG